MMPSRRRIPRPGRASWAVSALVLIALILLFLWLFRQRPPAWQPPPEPADGYLLTVWNVENLYDDQDDPKDHDPLENWFARTPAALAEKHRLLVSALLEQNHGRGPDLLAIVEVENRRAAELLRRALNARLPDGLKYPEAGLIHRDNISGRRIEPALISRLPAAEDPVLDFGHRRILAARVEVNDHPLTILVSHWTSRVRSGTEEKRAAYGKALYDAFLAEYRFDPSVDLLICGDFNDEPSDPSVAQSLRAIGDPTQILPGDPQPYLLNLMSGLDPEQSGTYLYRRRWQILDQIVVSPGLLDPRGWRVRPDTLLIRNAPHLRAGRHRGPHRFGNPDNPNPRGPSDHFAVSVRLGVRAAAPAPKAEIQ